ncbi:hypothetical protein YN1_8200 [Nanoarchaeota archaeon]
MVELYELLKNYGLESLYEPIKNILIRAYLNRGFETNRGEIRAIANKYNVREDIERILLNLGFIKESSYNYTKGVVLYYLNPEKLNIIEEVILENIEENKEKIVEITSKYPLSFLKYLSLVYDRNGHIFERMLTDSSFPIYKYETPADNFLKYLEDEISTRHIEDLRKLGNMMAFIKHEVPKYVKKETTEDIFIKNFVKSIIFNTDTGRKLFFDLIKDLEKINLATISTLYDSRLDHAGLLYSTHILVIKQILELLNVENKTEDIVDEILEKFDKDIKMMYVLAILGKIEIESRKGSLNRNELLRYLDNYGVPEGMFAEVIDNLLYPLGITSKYNYENSIPFVMTNPEKLKEPINKYCEELAKRVLYS